MRFAKTCFPYFVLALLVSSPLFGQTAPADETQADADSSLLRNYESEYVPPLWEFRADWLMLRRDMRGTGVALPLGAFTSRVGQYDSPYTAGMEFNGRRRLGPGVMEVKYFQVDSFEAATPSQAVGLFRVTTAYDSAIRNVELNFLTDLDTPVRWLAGFRYISYNEDFSANFTHPVVPNRSDTKTDNNLYGGQVGAELDLYPFNGYAGLADFFHLRGFAKFGVFGQEASGSRQFTSTTVSSFLSGQRGGTVLAPEIGLMGGLQATQRMSVDWGYRMLFLDGVFTAGTTNGATAPNPTSLRMDRSQVLLHGFNLGLTLTY